MVTNQALRALLYNMFKTNKRAERNKGRSFEPELEYFHLHFHKVLLLVAFILKAKNLHLSI